VRRGCVIGLSILVLLLIVIFGALLVLDRRYEFMWAARRVHHHELVAPNAGLRVSIQPDRASAYLLSRLQVPEWAFSRILPYEAAIMLEPKQDHVESTFYINAQRFGPHIVEYVRDTNLVSRITLVQWQSPELRREERGVLVVKGTLPVDRPAQETVLRAWRQFTPSGPLAFEGDHFVEAVLDNRTGSGLITLFSLLAASGIPDAQLERENLLTQNLLEARLTADIVEHNEVEIAIQLTYREDGLEEDKGAKEFLFEVLYGTIKQQLQTQYGVELEGGTRWEGPSLKGYYRLKDADRLLSGVP
jgi:hypothetical protein